MPKFRTFVVIPALPPSLEPLRELAYNLWWTWTPGAIELFRRLDLDLWEEVGHNPVAMLSRVSQERLEEVAADKAYASHLARVADQFYIYRHGRTWYDDHFPNERQKIIAYFSAEFGLHESLPVYSGGLGVLAGDHLKSASDLGIPLVAVGLMYRHGYFQQTLTEDGWQFETYPTYDFHQWPATLVKGEDGQPVKVQVELGVQKLTAQVWRVEVGRVSLFLLDADVAENAPELRGVTSRLYGGDAEMRIRQEILLGVGGYRVLRAVGITPVVCHMNEGHAAFMALERTRQYMEEHGLSYQEAREAVAGGNIFTTHTPVPAGIDRFDVSLIERYLLPMTKKLGIAMPDLLNLGREGDNGQGSFCMPVLALRTAFRSNGVSKLHGSVSRNMWQSCWPAVPVQEIPVGHVTNGIHTLFWTSPQMAELYDQYLGPNWADEPDNPEVWRRVDDIPDAELWRVHVRRRERLVGAVRRRVREQMKRRGAPASEVQLADVVLDPEALTIGFARRFAPYKRATLLFKNMDRLRAIVSNTDRPVQFIFAGKAHPADGAGKELIKQVAAICSRPEFKRRIIFLENYDISLARTLVRGVDVWLNNPLQLHEASGTSGMKLPSNGGLNLSCLDGWWPEGYNGENGWAIGDGRVFDDLTYQDHVESEALYNLIERELVPTFYTRAADDVPRGWVARMKEGMKTLCPAFNTHRMLKDYLEGYYRPAMERYSRLSDEGFAMTRRLTAWKQTLRDRWSAVRVVDIWAEWPEQIKVGDKLPLRTRVHLGEITPADVSVEAYFGPVSADGDIVSGDKIEMKHVAEEKNGDMIFEGDVPCRYSGRFGYTIRVVPNNEDLCNRYVHGMLVWAP